MKLLIKKEIGFMKKLIISAFAIMLASAVYADGTAFTPLNFNDTSYSGETTSSSFAPVTTTISDEAVGNGNIQNAISQLDNAQIDTKDFAKFLQDGHMDLLESALMI